MVFAAAALIMNDNSGDGICQYLQKSCTLWQLF